MRSADLLRSAFFYQYERLSGTSRHSSKPSDDSIPIIRSNYVKTVYCMNDSARPYTLQALGYSVSARNLARTAYSER
jgi:hypothetical protein